MRIDLYLSQILHTLMVFLNLVCLNDNLFQQATICKGLMDNFPVEIINSPLFTVRIPTMQSNQNFQLMQPFFVQYLSVVIFDLLVNRIIHNKFFDLFIDNMLQNIGLEPTRRFSLDNLVLKNMLMEWPRLVVNLFYRRKCWKLHSQAWLRGFRIDNSIFSFVQIFLRFNRVQTILQFRVSIELGIKDPNLIINRIRQIGQLVRIRIF